MVKFTIKTTILAHFGDKHRQNRKRRSGEFLTFSLLDGLSDREKIYWKSCPFTRSKGFWIGPGWLLCILSLIFSGYKNAAPNEKRVFFDPIGKEAQRTRIFAPRRRYFRTQREKYLPKAVKVLGKSDGTRGKGHLWILSHHKWDNRKSVAPDCLRINFYYARPEKLVIFAAPCACCGFGFFTFSEPREVIFRHPSHASRSHRCAHRRTDSRKCRASAMGHDQALSRARRREPRGASTVASLLRARMRVQPPPPHQKALEPRGSL